MVTEMKLFQPFQVSGLKLKNRVVMVPLVMNLATEDGDITDELIKRYLRIARGGVGWLAPPHRYCSRCERC